MPRTVSAREAKNRLGAVVDWALANHDEVIVESRGRPTVVIMPFSEYEKVRALREEARRREALERMRELRDRALARNRDLAPEEGDALAERFTRELVEELAAEGKIRFQPEER